ncbi:DUF1847 domain-containing protein [Sporomusa acidovorans]|uniref:Metal-binding protein n=1 Tax=Sporomusa acidovorans (strain ATCC 49682 / DSM 3132 / Mol) TaxID=1123286 RepID=A0ABZ3J190_SPOA4|nr:DUF1847 domain-containing protein [Sporomusa acidovorans]SDF85986.1 Uncharacterized metal-binding protein [Sporomusa acidovorans]
MQCGLCKVKNCSTGQNCPGLQPAEIEAVYDTTDQQLMMAAAKIEGRYYMQLSRLEESVKFAQEIGCTTIGVAFCIGLANEAKYIVQYFQKFFTVHSVCCKVCGFDKHQLDLEQIKADRYEAMCNPAIQAKILNDEKTELNFAVGLCVGHDMIFTRHSTAPVSTLVAKDRLLSHNPLGAIYAGYWRNKRLGLMD